MKRLRYQDYYKTTEILNEGDYHVPVFHSYPFNRPRHHANPRFSYLRHIANTVGDAYLSEKTKMAPIKRKGKSASTSSFYAKKAKTSRAHTLGGVVMGPLADSTKDMASRAGVTNFSRTRHAHVPKFKRGKTVSKSLKKKVKSVIAEKDTVQGHYRQYQVGAFVMCPTSNRSLPLDGFGSNYDYGLSTYVGGLPELYRESPWSFHPNQMLHVASVLWNSKTDTVSWGLGATNGFAIPSLEFMVKSSKTTYELKNLTSRVIIMDIYTCRPKKKGISDYDYRYDGISGTSGNPNISHYANSASTQGVVTFGSSTTGSTSRHVSNLPPKATWNDAVSRDIDYGFQLGTPNPLDIGLCPTSYVAFNQAFHTEHQKVVLDPGQSFDYVIQGPRNMKWNFRDHFDKEGMWLATQPYSVCPLVVVHPDIVRGATAVPANAVGYEADASPTLSVNRLDQYVLSMPDQIGVTLPTFTDAPTAVTALSGKVLTLNNRRRKNAFFNYFTTPPVTITSHEPRSAQPSAN